VEREPGRLWRAASERSFARLGRNRRLLSKDYEYQAQTSEAPIDVASIRFMLGPLAPVVAL
jgi:transposase